MELNSTILFETFGSVDERLFEEKQQCDNCSDWTRIDELKRFEDDELCPTCYKKLK